MFSCFFDSLPQGAMGDGRLFAPPVPPSSQGVGRWCERGKSGGGDGSGQHVATAQDLREKKTERGSKMMNIYFLGFLLTDTLHKFDLFCLPIFHYHFVSLYSLHFSSFTFVDD